MFSILKHRLVVNNQGMNPMPAPLCAFSQRLDEYRSGDIDFEAIRDEAGVALPDDQILAFLWDLA